MSILTTTKKKTRSLTVTLMVISAIILLSPFILESVGFLTTEPINSLGFRTETTNSP